MHSNIYSFLFRAANIKEENIIDSHAAWNEANIISLQMKERKTHCLYFILKLIEGWDFDYNKINKAQILLRLLGGFCATMNGLENVTYYFQAFIP